MSASPARAEKSLPSDTTLINIHQLLELAPISYMTVWRWCKRGIIPPPIKLGGRNYWKREEVLQALGLSDTPASSGR